MPPGTLQLLPIDLDVGLLVTKADEVLERGIVERRSGIAPGDTLIVLVPYRNRPEECLPFVCLQGPGLTRRVQIYSDRFEQEVVAGREVFLEDQPRLLGVGERIPDQDYLRLARDLPSIDAMVGVAQVPEDLIPHPFPPRTKYTLLPTRSYVVREPLALGWRSGQVSQASFSATCPATSIRSRCSVKG